MGKTKMYFSNIINEFATKADFGAELIFSFFFTYVQMKPLTLKKSRECILQL